MTIAMLLFGVLTLISACGVVFARKSLHSALSLVVTLFLVAVHFALLGADFLAALQVLIYAGAIMVLVIFVIMLLGLEQDAERDTFRLPRYFAASLCGILIGLMMFIFGNDVVLPIAKRVGSGAIAEEPARTTISPNGEIVALEAESHDATAANGFFGTPADVGAELLGRFVFPFEISALLLLAAVIGAVVLAYEPRRPLESGRGLGAMKKLAVDKATE